MSRYARVLALLLGIWPAAPAKAGGPEPAADLARLARQRADAARRTYLTAWANYRDGYANEELLYRWSRRWLEAERQVDTSREGQVAACRAHLARMRQIEAIVQKLRRSHTATIDRVSAAEFYRVEAELWLAEARQGRRAP